MPELPEVEHARRALAGWLAEATLTRALVVDPRILDQGVTAPHVERALRGRGVNGVDRRGKWLRLRLDRGLLFSHLGMTGRWVLAGREDEVRFAKVVLHVARGGAAHRVVYADARLFGRFVVAPHDIEAWTALGADPLHDGIDADALAVRLGRRKGPIKAVLLDQAVLAGVGNIQATEGLFFAGIDPRRAACALSRAEVAEVAAGVLRSIHATLAEHPPAGSAEGELRYVNEPGSDNPFTIYGREGTPCPRCGAVLQKIVLAGRGTVFCAQCQR